MYLVAGHRSASVSCVHAYNHEFGHQVTGHRVVHKMSLLFFNFLFHPTVPKSGNLLKLG